MLLPLESLEDASLRGDVDGRGGFPSSILRSKNSKNRHLDRCFGDDKARHRKDD